MIGCQQKRGRNKGENGAGDSGHATSFEIIADGQDSQTGTGGNKVEMQLLKKSCKQLKQIFSSY